MFSDTIFTSTCNITTDKFCSLLQCVFITCLYVGSFYILRGANGQYMNRDLPQTIKFRFCCILIISIIAFVLVRISCVEDEGDTKGHTVFNTMGIRFDKIFPAMYYPLALTALLFLGPIVQVVTEHIKCQSFEYFWNKPLKYYTTDLIWLRTYVVGPVSEEFVFRACLIPLLSPAYGVTQAMFIAPFLFGAAHLHHMVGMMKLGYSFLESLSICTFQFAYTTVFGIYCSYLFIQTRHLISIIIVHTFCNAIGFPDVWEIWEPSTGRIRRTILCIFYFAGFSTWMWILPTFTSPSLFNNNMV